MKLGEAMYTPGRRWRRRRPAAATAARGRRRPERAAGGQEGVVDVDFEEVDENKKGKSA